MTIRLRGEFIDGSAGRLAIVLREPARDAGGVALFLPPFGDEMNKSRRMVAMQARAMAAAGWVVATLDPRGTGDSAREHGDATWQGWHEDALCAWAWLASRYREPAMLWGLRLGALLACDLIASGRIAPSALLLWQPVASGKTFFRQLLRAAKARALADGRDASAAPAVQEDECEEAGGYAIGGEMIAGAEAALVPSGLARPLRAIIRDVSVVSPLALSPSSQELSSRLRGAGAEVDAQTVSGPSFWASQEIAEAPALVETTTQAIAALAHTTMTT